VPALGGLGAVCAWLAFAALVLALRYAVLPKVADYRAEIEQAASRAVGQPVRIGRIEARWQGLNPDLILDDVVIADRQGRRPSRWPVSKACCPGRAWFACARPCPCWLSTARCCMCAAKSMAS
jgi:hypothetical protein